MSYTLDQEAAKKGGSLSSNRIEEGLSVVKIEQAYETVSSGGAVGVHIDMIDGDKKTGNITIWTKKKDGGQNDYGINQLNAIMYVAGVKEMNQQPGTVDYYDFDSSRDAKKEAQIFPELMGKFIAVIMKKDTYQNQTSGELKPKYELVAPLNQKTKQTVKEMLTNAEADGYKDILKYAEKQSEKADLALSQSNVTPINQVAAGQDFQADESDDIPF